MSRSLRLWGIVLGYWAAAAPCAAFGGTGAPAVRLGAPVPLAGGAAAPRCGRARPAGSVLACAVPRRPPPPPPKKAAVGAAGASHQKIKDPELQAGAWRDELGLGEALPLPLRAVGSKSAQSCRGAWRC